jgi:3-dehydroquinate synthase
MPRVTVALAPEYDVVVGSGVRAEVADVLAGRRMVAVVAPASVADRYAPAVMDALREAGVVAEQFSVGDGEANKSLATVESLCRSWVHAGLLRDDAVVAIGGGVTGDTVGFAASVYHRGIAIVQCPTTLLAMVDAAIGGKTAVNLPEGKNLVGAFHQPLAVLADVDTLVTLPDREYVAGLGEVAKYALMGGPSDPSGVFALLTERRDEVLARDPWVLSELITACVSMKADVVARDPEERTGLRAHLNYGHTLAHALETWGGDDLLHGEAVAVGLVFAAALAAETGLVTADELDRTRAMVRGLGLPVAVEGHPRGSDLLPIMRRDKKAAGGLSFVLLGENGLQRVDDPPFAAVEHALTVVGVTA